MRVVLDGRHMTPHFPGIGRYVRQLAAHLPACFAPGDDFTLLTEKETAVSPFSLSQQWRIPPLLRGHTLYHSPYYIMPYFPGVPAVVTLYDLIPQKFPALTTAKARLFFRLFTRMALHTANHVITISEAARQDFLAAYPIKPDRITAVPLAPAPHFQPMPNAPITRPLPDKYVLYVGSNKPHKNLVRLVQAWQPVHQQFRDVALMIAGAWDNRYPQPKEWVEKLGLETAVHFFGPVTETELPILYSRAQLFVFPTLYEGFGLPVIEAMACGTAVACSNQSSLPEVGGDAAVYFNPANTEEITQSIITILKEEDLQTALQKQALQQAKKFTWEQTAKQTTAVYKMIHQ